MIFVYLIIINFINYLLFNLFNYNLNFYNLFNFISFKMNFFQGMIALRRGASTVTHEDFMDAIMEVQAKKKSNLNYYA